LKTATTTFAVILALALVAAAGVTTNERPLKNVTIPIPSKGDSKEGGETIETALLISSLPFDDTGSTCDNIHNYDEACPYTASLSPDVVYEYVAPYDMYVDIHTCESGYDTKLYVYENAYTPGSPIACNDDNVNCPGEMYRSWIESLSLTMGNTYYIVVDGYGGDCGDYQFHMYELDNEGGPCDVVCPPGAVLEGEPTCYDGYVDTYNAGCNSDPPTFFVLPDATHTVICGESGIYNGLSTRDTDWYEITLPVDREVKLTICAEFPVVFGFIDASLGCPGTGTFDYYDTASVNTKGVLSEYLPAGTWWIFVSTNGWPEGYPCGVQYVLDVDGVHVSPVESASWSMVKALYR